MAGLALEVGCALVQLDCVVVVEEALTLLKVTDFDLLSFLENEGHSEFGNSCDCVRISLSYSCFINIGPTEGMS